MLLGRLIQSALGLLHVVSEVASRQHGFPEVSLQLHPLFWHNDTLSAIEIRMVVSGFHVSAGEPLLVHHLKVGNIPTTQYLADHIVAQDDLGRIYLTKEDFKSEIGDKRRWISSRETIGTITVVYKATVLPEFDENEICGPNVQLRVEGSGTQALGIGFLILPTKTYTSSFRGMRL
jgi:hypothetical protein